MRRYYIFIAVLCAVALVMVGVQAQLSRGPVGDQKIVDDLNQIDTTVQSYANSNNKLPASLGGLTFATPLNNKLTSYTYSTHGDFYTICATFRTATAPQPYPSNNTSTFRDDSPNYHKAGYQCFSHTETTITANNFNDQIITDTPSPTPSPSLSNGTTASLVPCNQPNSNIKNVLASRQVKAITSTQLTIALGNTTNYLAWSNPPTVYDKSCAVIGLGQLAVGDTVTVYYNENTAQLIAVQKLN